MHELMAFQKWKDSSFSERAALLKAAGQKDFHKGKSSRKLSGNKRSKLISEWKKGTQSEKAVIQRELGLSYNQSRLGFYDLPDHAQRALIRKHPRPAVSDLNRIRGVVVSGEIYINAASIEHARQAIETFMHEAAGHGGVDALLKAFGEKATTQLDAMLKRLFPDDYAAVQRSYEPSKQVSETLARIMQRVGPEMSAQTRTRWQRVMDWLRNALNNLGVKRWSTNDVMALLRRGVDAVRKPAVAKKSTDVSTLVGNELTYAAREAGVVLTPEQTMRVINRDPAVTADVQARVSDARGEGAKMSVDNERYAPFYSALTKTVQALPQETMTVQQARAAIEKGAKKDEIVMSGILTDPLSPLAGKQPGDKVTKAELTGYALERQATVQDVVLGGENEKTQIEFSAADFEDGDQYKESKGWTTNNLKPVNSSGDSAVVTIRERPNGEGFYAIEHGGAWNAGEQYLTDFETLDRAKEWVSENFKPQSQGVESPTHFSQYQLPGADEGSYREMFVTWPQRPDVYYDSFEEFFKAEFGEYSDPSHFAHAMASKRAKEKWEAKGGKVEVSDFSGARVGRKTLNWEDGHSQYSSIENPIVRIRRNIRTDADGKRTYFIEEMQGPGKGEQEKMPPELRKRIYEIGMKRALRDAVDEGADAIAWTTGEQQAERYSLEKQVEEVKAFKREDGTFDFSVKPVGETSYKDIDQIPEAKLEDHIGKELAAKVSAQPAGWQTYSGLDLKVGGEGLKRVYDQMLPAIANDLAKKFGVKAGRAEIHPSKSALTSPLSAYKNSIGDAWRVEDSEGDIVRSGFPDEESAQQWIADNPAKAPTVHSLPIPEALKTQQRGGNVLFSLRDENPEATSTKRAFTDAARAARGEEPTGVITKPAIDALKEGALAELARNKDAGRELVREIIGATGQPEITPEKEALLAMHRRTLQNEIEMQSDRAMDENLTPEQREIANERWDDLEQEITELEDATNRTGSAWSNWGRIRMQETLRDFSFAMLTKRARKAKGGEQLTRDERAELKAQADKIAALHEQELARRTELANIEREEAVAAAFQQGKAEAAKEAEENQPDPLIMEHSRQFVAKLRAKYSPAVRSVMGLFDKGIGSKAAGESDVKMSLAPDPEKPEWFTKVVQAGVIQMADKKLSKEKWLASLKVLTGDTEGNLDPYADELWSASRAIIEADIAADTEESKRVKATKMKRNASKEQLIEGMAERVAEDGDTSNLGRYLKKLAVKLIESGVDTREALVDAMHDSVKDIDPSLTREAVMDLWSDYGKFRPATTDEVKVKAAQLRGEVQQVRKLMDMEKGLAAKLTGIGRVEPSAEHRKLTKQVEDAKRRGGFTITDPARQLKTALDAIQARLKNEIADMDYAIATRKPLAEHKNAITYDAQTKALKAQRDAKKAEYEKLFPKDTAAADLAAISRALDRSIAELSEQIKSGDLYPSKQGRSLTSPEIEAKRARIEALRDERTVLRGLDTARVEAAKMAATQARVDELNRQRAAGWPDSPTGTPTVDTPLLAALKAKRDELLKERQASQRPPTDPEMRRIEALDKLIAEKQAKIAAGDTSSKPKSQNVKTAQVTAREAELRRLTVELAKLRNSDIARQLEQLKSRKSRQLADLLEKIAKKDFEPKAKPPEKPTDPELQSIEFQVSQAKGELMEGMAELARSRRTRFQKAKDTVADVFHTLRALMTGGEFSGVFRQGKLAALSHPVVTFGQAVPAMFRAFRSVEQEHAEMNKIWARPNAAAYKRSGLALHNPWDFTAAQLEGNYRSRWANKIPFIAGSGRAYTLFLNNLRAGLYDTLSASLSSTEGVLTAGQEKEIANLINKMTGSGNLGVRGQKASEYLNVFFFAPKFVASRFQMITGAVKVAGDVATGFQISKENNAVRKLVAKEYGRMLTGIAVMYALYAAFRGDDEPIETDPRSTKFGKIPMGNGSYIDPMAGLLQVTVFLNTLRTGEVKNKKGEIKSVWMDDDGTSAFGQGDGAFFTRFLRSKMSPVAGTLYDRFVTHKMVDGKPFTYTDAVLNLVTPMTYKDIYEAMRAQGVPKGTILSTLTMFGEGLSTYENDSKPTHARSHRR